MAGYEINVGGELLPGFLTGQDGLAKLVEAVLNQVLEAQVTESLGAARNGRATATACVRAPSTLASAPSRCGCPKPGTAVSPPTSSSAISAANRHLCWR